MKKMISLLLATAMLCSAASAYDISGGEMKVTPAAVQSDLSSRLTTLGLGEPRVTGENASSAASALDGGITLYVSGTKEATRAVSAQMNLADPASALRYSQDFGAVCGAIMSLATPGVSSAVANNALKLEDAAVLPEGDNLRTYFTDNTLYTYEVSPKNLRFTALAYPESSKGIQLIVNDQFLALDVQPKNVDGRTLVPARGIFEQLGAVVTWDQASQTATMLLNQTEVKLTLGSKTALVNGVAKTLDVPAQLVNNRILVPVRFISESLGILIGWSANPQAVVIAAR